MPWHILLYHDVNWEEGRFLRGLGGTCPPDIFRQHVEAARKVGEIVSPEEAEQRLAHSKNERLISFWFDDGLIGVRRYAYPILSEFGLQGTVAICSRFYRKREMFWSFQLSCLSTMNGIGRLRDEFEHRGYKSNGSVRKLIMQNCDEKALNIVDQVYQDFVPEQIRHDAFKIFMDQEDVRFLKNQGWTISNHTAAHYQVGDDRRSDRLNEQFEECENAIQEDFSVSCKYWVLPFDRDRSSRLVERFREMAPNRKLVLVGNQVNHAEDLKTCAIHRIHVLPTYSGVDVRRMLHRIH